MVFKFFFSRASADRSGRDAIFQSRCLFPPFADRAAQQFMEALILCKQLPLLGNLYLPPQCQTTPEVLRVTSAWRCCRGEPVPASTGLFMPPSPVVCGRGGRLSCASEIKICLPLRSTGSLPETISRAPRLSLTLKTGRFPYAQTHRQTPAQGVPCRLMDMFGLLSGQVLFYSLRGHPSQAFWHRNFVSDCSKQK